MEEKVDDFIQKYQETEDKNRVESRKMKSSLVQVICEKQNSIISQLKIKLSDSQSILEDLVNVNDEIEPFDFGENTISNNGEFFQQMRYLEALEEDSKNRIDGMKQILQELKSQLSVLESTEKRISKENFKIGEGIPRLEQSLHALKNKNKGCVEGISKAKYEEQVLGIQILDLEKVQKEKQSILESELSKNIDDLLPQKKQLLEEIKLINNKITKKTKKLQDLHSASRLQEQRIETSKKKEETPMKWFNERITLINKIKKLQHQIDQCEKKPNTGYKINQRKRVTVITNTLTDDDIKKALQLEINELKKIDTTFLDEALLEEKNYQDELTAELEYVNLRIAEIEQFQKETNCLYKGQSSTPALAKRVEILKQELAALRSKL